MQNHSTQPPIALSGIQSCKDEYTIRKQEEVLQESLMMVPDCQRRLAKAFEELKKIVEEETDMTETGEYQTAQKVLEDAKSELPDSAGGAC
ncbi:hypothetical protein PR048_021360 [Dryococelus australis]|uniref:Tubulin-specific chaperone A n=1 Tax=Dryococelus australis TaxID=614101 RepID=A0ABQ9GY13_9NEOP|nr:hypothetical protein PR048_021360 [Dryococelus australis]